MIENADIPFWYFSLTILECMELMILDIMDFLFFNEIIIFLLLLLIYTLQFNDQKLSFYTYLYMIQ